MLKRFLVGLTLSAATVTLVYAQAPAPAAPAGNAPGQRGSAVPGGRAPQAGGDSRYLPSQAQWDAMDDTAKAYVDNARQEAGNDPDLKFDFSVFCQASGGATNKDRANLGVPEGAPYKPFPAPSPAKVMPPQHLFDNMWWFGNTGVGAWLFTSSDGYILFDTMDNAAEARDIIVGGMKQVGLDPNKIRYVVFGHNHLDHTGGGHYIEENYHPAMIMGHDDWDIYFKTMKQVANAGPNANGLVRQMDDKTPMTRGLDAVDGEVIQVGDLKATIYEMTGHTPGSIGMVIPVRWAGKEHPILIVTAGTDVHNRDAFVGGYEHIWDKGEEAGVESVMQVHPNTNLNLLARTQYVNDNFDKLEKTGENPMLYGPVRTARYIEIMRNCTEARMEVLGW